MHGIPATKSLQRERRCTHLSLLFCPRISNSLFSKWVSWGTSKAAWLVLPRNFGHIVELLLLALRKHFHSDQNVFRIICENELINSTTSQKVHDISPRTGRFMLILLFHYSSGMRFEPITLDDMVKIPPLTSLLVSTPSFVDPHLSFEVPFIHGSVLSVDIFCCAWK